MHHAGAHVVAVVEEAEVDSVSRVLASACQQLADVVSAVQLLLVVGYLAGVVVELDERLEVAVEYHRPPLFAVGSFSYGFGYVFSLAVARSVAVAPRR